jgi:hypothetical protein
MHVKKRNLIKGDIVEFQYFLARLSLRSRGILSILRTRGLAHIFQPSEGLARRDINLIRGAFSLRVVDG